jgi:hypothetical protein
VSRWLTLLPTVYKIYNFLILNGNRPEDLIREGGNRRERSAEGVLLPRRGPVTEGWENVHKNKFYNLYC